MNLVIVTGMSGAGKTLAIRAFEDMGYFCVDNLPPNLLPNLRDRCASLDGCPVQNVAVVVDVRSGQPLDELVKTFPKLSSGYEQARILFLDATDEVLIQRFKETRRRHPLFERSHGIIESVAEERRMLVEFKELADKIIDTSDLEPSVLKSEIVNCFGVDSVNAGMIVTVTSFGFKWGVPLDADLVFDVRFLLNPHWVTELRLYDGRDQPVQEYVMGDDMTRRYLDKLCDLIGFSLPKYETEGKAYLNVAIGCTGGRHRSVTIADELGAFFRERGYRTIVEHRDVGKS